MRIFFAGSPEVAVPSLNILAEKHVLCGVLTNPPAAKGRRSKKTPTAVDAAVKHLKEQGVLAQDIPVFTPPTITRVLHESVAAIQPDMLVCFAYGKMFSAAFLQLFPHGSINIHPSLLPRWRGATPVPAVLLAGDTTSGITIQKLAKKMDTGDILAQKSTPVYADDTADTLLARSGAEAAVLLNAVLEDTGRFWHNAKKQNENQATYCSLLNKDDGKINWAHAAAFIERKIRAFTPWPGCFSFINGTKVAILEAVVYSSSSTTQKGTAFGTVLGVDSQEGILVQTGAGVLAVRRLQKQSKKPLAWKDFLNGSPNFVTSTFDNSL